MDNGRTGVKDPPPGRGLSTHVYPFHINYDLPSDAEVKSAVLRLRPHKAGSHTHLRTEYFKTWIRKAYPGEGATPPTPPIWKVDAACGHCPIYVEHWGDSALLGWTILLLILKGDTDNRGIGLLETLWKAV